MYGTVLCWTWANSWCVCMLDVCMDLKFSFVFDTVCGQWSISHLDIMSIYTTNNGDGGSVFMFVECMERCYINKRVRLFWRALVFESVICGQYNGMS